MWFPGISGLLLTRGSGVGVRGAGRPGRGRHGRELDGIDVLILALVFYSVSQDVAPVLSPYYFLQPHVVLSFSKNKKNFIRKMKRKLIKHVIIFPPKKRKEKKGVTIYVPGNMSFSYLISLIVNYYPTRWMFSASLSCT